MGVTVCWDNDAKTIARYEFADPWTWEQFHQAVSDIHELVRRVPNKVDYIADVSQTHVARGNSLFHIRRAIQDAPPNSGLLVVVGGGAFVVALLGVVSRFTRHVQTARNIEGARLILEARQRYRKERAQ